MFVSARWQPECHQKANRFKVCQACLIERESWSMSRWWEWESFFFLMVESHELGSFYAIWKKKVVVFKDAENLLLGFGILMMSVEIEGFFDVNSKNHLSDSKNLEGYHKESYKNHFSKMSTEICLWVMLTRFQESKGKSKESRKDSCFSLPNFRVTSWESWRCRLRFRDSLV